MSYDRDTQLASSVRPGTVLVAQAGPRLEAQQAFLRGPIILIDPGRIASTQVATRSYAVVSSAAEASLAVDRFLAHRELAERIAGRARVTASMLTLRPRV